MGIKEKASAFLMHDSVLSWKWDRGDLIITTIAGSIRIQGQNFNAVTECRKNPLGFLLPPALCKAIMNAAFERHEKLEGLVSEILEDYFDEQNL